MTTLPPEMLRDGQDARQRWRWARLGAAITPTAPDAGSFAALGDNSCLAFPQGVLHGTHRIAIGSGCLVNELVTLSAGPIVERVDDGEPIIVLADRVRLGRRSEIVALERVEIGECTGIAPAAYITDHNHTRLDPDQPISYQPLDVRPVSIGAGCSIGAGALILAGVRIGNHTQVGAGAVVTAGTYPSHSLMVGNPARVVHTTRP